MEVVSPCGFFRVSKSVAEPFSSASILKVLFYHKSRAIAACGTIEDFRVPVFFHLGMVLRGLN